MAEPSFSQQHAGGNPKGQPFVLGVDGGGTKTVAWIAYLDSDGKPEVVGRGIAGSSNLRAVGWSQTSANLGAALDAAWNESGLERRPVDSAVLALAGAASSEVQVQIAAWAEQQCLTKRLKVVHDAKAVLKAGTSEGWGVALVAGTGSVAFGQNSESAAAVSGGWGYWFGDEGGAFGLGQTALRAVALAADGRGPTTQLLPIICDRLGIEDPREMLSALSRTGDVRQAIAELADLVTTAAQEQDRVACQIVTQAGRDLAALVESVAKKLSMGTDFPLALAGGVMCRSQVVRDSFLQGLNEKNLNPIDVQMVADPVAGCLKMAATDLTSTGEHCTGR